MALVDRSAWAWVPETVRIYGDMRDGARTTAQVDCGDLNRDFKQLLHVALYWRRAVLQFPVIPAVMTKSSRSYSFWTNTGTVTCQTGLRSAFYRFFSCCNIHSSATLSPAAACRSPFRLSTNSGTYKVCVTKKKASSRLKCYNIARYKCLLSLFKTLCKIV
jgi:hypothetical protein